MTECRCPLCRDRVTSTTRGELWELQGRAAVAHALVLAYRDAIKVGNPDPCGSLFFRGVLRELDSLWERAPWDPPREEP